MPANAHTSQVDKYFHIYNEGSNGNTIFNDQEDYSTFLKFIKEYVSEPIDPKTLKKSFTVAGKTYHGTPHLPKNYFNRISLVGYSLIPNRFNLVLKQSEEGAIESFVRSLCTRYSIYFNKKYKRTGSMFVGPYKSVEVNASKQLSLLVRYLHQMGGLSSIHQYLNGGLPNWLSNHPKIKNYQEYLNDYQLTDEENILLNKVTFNHKSVEPIKQMQPEVFAKPEPQGSNHEKTSKTIKTHHRYPEMLFASTVFVVLFVLGFRNVLTHNVRALENTVDAGQVAGISIDSLEESYDNPKKIVAVIETDQPFIQIYSDMDVFSDIIGEAFNGDQYEISRKNSDWYEIQLPFYQKGYVKSVYVKESEVSAK